MGTRYLYAVHAFTNEIDFVDQSVEFVIALLGFSAPLVCTLHQDTRSLEWVA